MALSKSLVCATPVTGIARTSSPTSGIVVPMTMKLKGKGTSFLSLIGNNNTHLGNVKISQGRSVVVVKAATASDQQEKEKTRKEGFTQEMRAIAMSLHTRDVAKEGKVEPAPAPRPSPNLQGYLKFLVDNKLVYDTFEGIVNRAKFPIYAEFQNTGLERSLNLSNDLEWFRQQGHSIPEPTSLGTSYSAYIEELSEKDPPAFICHYYNFYFAHTAGGRMIGKMVADQLLDGKTLEFYKWEGNLKAMQNNIRDKINKIAESWSAEEKKHCLEETKKCFDYSGKILQLITS